MIRRRPSRGEWATGGGAILSVWVGCAVLVGHDAMLGAILGAMVAVLSVGGLVGCDACDDAEDAER